MAQLRQPWPFGLSGVAVGGDAAGVADPVGVADAAGVPGVVVEDDAAGVAPTAGVPLPAASRPLTAHAPVRARAGGSG